VPDKDFTIKGETVTSSTSTLNLMLPVLALSGGGFGGSTDGAGDNSMFMMLAMVLALGNKG
jgi:hypothetical protein